MPRPRNAIPSYRLDSSRNQGRVVIAGHAPIRFPGPYQSPESLAAYRRWLATYLATGAIEPLKADQAATVGDLVSRFLDEFVDIRYRKNGIPTSEPRSYRIALRPLCRMFWDQPAEAFRPIDLKKCRAELIRQGYTRSRINQHCQRIRRCFKWGVSEGLLPAATWQSLASIEGLRAGEGGRESKIIRPVPQSLVEAVRPFVTPPVWAAIQIQIWTGARPGEILSMRTRDILDDDPGMPAEVRDICWVYRPESHKTEHHGRRRLILLGSQARTLIEPWLRPADPDEYLFSPADAMAWHRSRRQAEASTHRQQYRQAEAPRRSPGRRYTIWSYERAIRRACERAAGMPANLIAVPRGLPAEDRDRLKIEAKCWRAEHRECYWHPHQLRHNAATAITAAYGIEVARIILGHAHIRTTELYAEADLIKAARAVEAWG